MNRTTAILAGAILLGTGAAFAIPDSQGLEGNPRVVDGDTLAFGQQRVRLWGIDAFENSQRCEDGLIKGATYGCGTAAWGYMIRLTQGQRVRCVQKDIDRYGRIVAVCYARPNGWTTHHREEDLGKAMVLAGWAFDYTRYSGGYYKDVQDGAREAKAGAWAGSFQWPWDYRHHK